MLGTTRARGGAGVRATCSRPATCMQSLPHTPTLLLTGCLDLARAAESGLKSPPRVSIVALMSGERAQSPPSSLQGGLGGRPLAATHSPTRAPPPPPPPRAAVLWFLDSAKCEDHGREWHRECAEQGSPASQHASIHPSSNLCAASNHRCTTGHPRKQQARRTASTSSHFASSRTPSLGVEGSGRGTMWQGGEASNGPRCQTFPRLWTGCVVQLRAG
jgi:hypothetical protein